jgi:hypothetical protein
MTERFETLCTFLKDNNYQVHISKDDIYIFRNMWAPYCIYHSKLQEGYTFEEIKEFITDDDIDYIYKKIYKKL